MNKVTEVIEYELNVSTSPHDPYRYYIGQVYVFEIGTHLVNAICVYSDGQGSFGFDEISDSPLPNRDYVP